MSSVDVCSDVACGEVVRDDCLYSRVCHDGALHSGGLDTPGGDLPCENSVHHGDVGLAFGFEPIETSQKVPLVYFSQLSPSPSDDEGDGQEHPTLPSSQARSDEVEDKEKAEGEDEDESDESSEEEEEDDDEEYEEEVAESDSLSGSVFSETKKRNRSPGRGKKSIFPPIPRVPPPPPTPRKSRRLDRALRRFCERPSHSYVIPMEFTLVENQDDFCKRGAHPNFDTPGHQSRYLDERLTPEIVDILLCWKEFARRVVQGYGSLHMLDKLYSEKVLVDYLHLLPLDYDPEVYVFHPDCFSQPPLDCKASWVQSTKNRPFVFKVFGANRNFQFPSFVTPAYLMEYRRWYRRCMDILQHGRIVINEHGMRCLRVLCDLESIPSVFFQHPDRFHLHPGRLPACPPREYENYSIIFTRPKNAPTFL